MLFIISPTKEHCLLVSCTSCLWVRNPNSFGLGVGSSIHHLLQPQRATTFSLACQTE